MLQKLIIKFLSFNLLFLGSLGQSDMNSAQAEVPPDLDKTAPSLSLVKPSSAIAPKQINRLGQKSFSDSTFGGNNNSLSSTDNSLGQINNVSSLRDVSYGDWAYEALKSLVERYGCIVGYPNNLYLGDRSLTRYEFAAGLNACMNSIERLLQENAAVLREDIDKLARLTQEFRQELTALGTRVDNLETRTAFLEDHTFSTTTKLTGLAWINVTGATAGGTITAEGLEARSFNSQGPTAFRDPATGFRDPYIRKVEDSPPITMSSLNWLTLTTSFTGQDALITTFAAGNGDSPPNHYGSAGTYNNFAVPFTDQTPISESGNPQVTLSELYYRFPITNSLQLGIGPAVNYYSFFDFNPYTIFFNGAGSFQSIEHPLVANIKRGSGAVFEWKMSDQFNLTAGYLAQNTEFLPSSLRTASDPNTGLFGGTNSVVAQLTYSPTPNANINFLYGHSNVMPNPVGQSQPLWSIHGVADDGPNGSPQGGLGYSQTDVFALSFDWTITDNFGVFGRYNFGITSLNPTSDVAASSIDAQALQLGLAFPNLGTMGAMGTFSFVMPFSVLSGREFLVSGGGNGASQYNLELAYFYPVNRNISIVPSFYMVLNPNNFNNNAPVFVGNLRTQFTF
jgi:hypothetical protein